VLRQLRDAQETLASVVLVSAADKLHNVTAILSDYRERGDALWPVFNKEAATGHHSRLIRDLDVAVSQLEVARPMSGA
jgi:hypothetical protein